MTTAYFHTAREALRLARSWQRGADDYDAAWRAKSLAEAKRCRERAAWLLRTHGQELDWREERSA